jgi:hypothetical protein
MKIEFAEKENVSTRHELATLEPGDATKYRFVVIFRENEYGERCVSFASDSMVLTEILLDDLMSFGKTFPELFSSTKENYREIALDIMQKAPYALEAVRSESKANPWTCLAALVAAHESTKRVPR